MPRNMEPGDIDEDGGHENNSNGAFSSYDS
jgi:hypothetical protein